MRYSEVYEYQYHVWMKYHRFGRWHHSSAVRDSKDVAFCLEKLNELGYFAKVISRPPRRKYERR